MQPDQLFFSIVIPAHNEALYIENTLRCASGLNYPRDRYEVFVVENGSTDDTHAIAKKSEKNNITIMQSPVKGVSAARNMGLDSVDKQSDWVIFLDADTQLRENFLNELNSFLKNNNGNNYTVVTTEVRPLSGTRNAKIWFNYYNLGHRMTKTSMSINMMKSSLRDHIRFDESITMGEDLILIDEAREEGEFFYLPTPSVYTSTRRFDKEGWWKIFFSWTFVAMLPDRIKRKFDYKVVR